MELGVYQGKNTLKAEKNGAKSRIKELKDKINIGKLAFLLLVFLASRTSVFSLTTPFGAALYAVEFTGGIPVAAGVLVLAGVWFSGQGIIAVLKYATALLLFTAAVKKTGRFKTNTQKGVLMACTVMLSGIIPYITGGIFLYDIMIIILEGIMVLVSVYLFARAKTLIFTSKTRETANSEDIVALTALAAVSIMGAGRLELYGISLAGCLCVITTLLFAYENGAVTGAASGITIGLIYGFYSGDVTGVLGAFALASMLAGFFAKYGKSGSALGFLFANSLVTFYTVGTTAMLVGLGEAAAGALIFSVLPQRVTAFFNMTGEKKKSHAAKLKEYTYMSVMKNARAITEVADIYSRISENKLLGTQSAASSFFEKTARKLCSGCSLRQHCWRKEFHRTYTSFFVMLELCGKKGFAQASDVPDELMRKCIRKDSIKDIFNSMYEVYRVDRLWETRATEGRNMAARQMECVGEQIAGLAKISRGGFSFDSALENGIKTALNENRVPASSVFVCNEGGGKKIDVILQTETDPERVGEIINTCTGEDYRILAQVENRLRFFRQDGLKVTVGKMRQAKDNNSYNGDTALWEYLENGKFLMVLSDGMGSGEKASDDSRATAEIIRRLMRCGFRAENAIAIVNSVLVLKSAETSFATVDMGVIDLKKCEIDFFKLGAAQSFIKRGEEVRTVAAASLPAGVFGETEAGRLRVKLSRGDAVIMASDGVTGTGNDDGIKKIIAGYDGSDPQEMARLIIEYSKKEHADIVSDDMTVVVAMLGEKED